MKQEKWRSKYFWVGVAGIVVSAMLHFGAIDTGMGANINEAVALIGDALGLFGVWNDAGNKGEW